MSPVSALFMRSGPWPRASHRCNGRLTRRAFMALARRADSAQQLLAQPRAELSIDDVAALVEAMPTRRSHQHLGLAGSAMDVFAALHRQDFVVGPVEQEERPRREPADALRAIGLARERRHGGYRGARQSRADDD